MGTGSLDVLNLLDTVFLKVLNMSITASYVILVVLLVRLCIRLLFPEVPKKYMYWLWIVVAFRLACPWSFGSQWSLFRWSLFDMTPVQQVGSAQLEYIPLDVTSSEDGRVDISVGIPAMDQILQDGGQALKQWAGGSQEPPITSASPSLGHGIRVRTGMLMWLCGVLILALYGAISYVRIHRRMEKAILLRDNIYQSERVKSPFILGLRHPRIYIPFRLREADLIYVLAHEEAHIRRRDHLIKPLACLLLAVHWFNPLVWIALAEMGKDMELSCDEEVLSQGENIRRAYSETLLYLSAHRKQMVYSPLAFGETGVKRRIKNALNWKGPKLSTTIGTGIACILVVLLCAANPLKPAPSEEIYGKYYANPDDAIDAMRYYRKGDILGTNVILYITSEGELLIERRDFAQGPNELDPVEWLLAGQLEEIQLTRDNFNDYFYYNGGIRPSDWWDPNRNFLVPTRQASHYRQNNWKAWRVIMDSRMIYLLQQRDGEIYLAFGYYDAEGETDLASDDSEIYFMKQLTERTSEEMTRWGVTLIDEYGLENIVSWEPEEEIRQALEQQEGKEN